MERVAEEEGKREREEDGVSGALCEALKLASLDTEAEGLPV